MLIGTGYIRDLDGALPGNPHTLRIETVNPMELPREIIAQIPRDVLETLLEITTPKGKSLDLVHMPGATALQSFDDGTGLRQPVPLAFSSANSYVIQDIERIDPKTEPAEEADPRGPFTPVTFVRALGPIGAAPPSNPADVTENDVANLVVMGDSDFVANSFYDRGSGKDLFLNSVNYLVGDHSLFSLRPKALTTREFNVDRNQENFVKFSSWLPFARPDGVVGGPGMVGTAVSGSLVVVSGVIKDILVRPRPNPGTFQSADGFEEVTRRNYWINSFWFLLRVNFP